MTVDVVAEPILQTPEGTEGLRGEGQVRVVDAVEGFGRLPTVGPRRREKKGD
jgi:hypothetical protein